MVLESNLEELARSLEPDASALLRSAALSVAFVDSAKRKIARRHDKLETMSEGRLYYELALAAVQELETEVTFTQPFPFPKISSKIGTRTHDVVFVYGGPNTGLCFPELAENGKIRVEMGCGPYDEVRERDLSTRMHVSEVVVDSLDSFNKFLREGLKGFREANPFVPLQGLPNEGDLVCCFEYATHPKMYTNIFKPLGNVIPPKDRLGIVKRIREEDERRIYDIKTLTEKDVVCLERKDEDRVKKISEVDELQIVRRAPFSNGVLEEPFMTNDEAEEVIWPILLRNLGDPRAYALHMRHQQMLSRQLSEMLREGAGSQEIAEIFTENYGLSIEEMFRLAGGTKNHFAGWVKPKLEEISSSTNCYSECVGDMIRETSRVLGISEEELASPVDSIEGIDETDNLYARLLHRKVRAQTWDGRPVQGYVAEIHLRYPDEKGFGVNVYNDMTNPHSLESVSSETIEPVGVDEYKTATSMFEVEQTYYFLRHQIVCHSEANPDLEERAIEATEAIEDIFEGAVEKEKDRFKKRSNRRVDDEDDEVDLPSSGDTYQNFKKRLDERVVGALLSFGYTEEEVRDYVLKESNNHPLAPKALDEIFEYRNRKKTNPFTRPGPRRMLQEVIESGATEPGEVMGIINRWMSSREFNEDPEAMTSAMNHIGVLVFDREAGEPFAPLLEFMHEETTGSRRPYLNKYDLASIVGCFIEDGKPSLLGVEKARKGEKRNNSANRVYVKEYETGDFMELYITDPNIDYKLTSLILLEEIARMNHSDPRNQDYFRFRELLQDEDLIKVLGGIGIYPKQESNYFLHAEIDDNRHGYMSRSYTEASLVIANARPQHLRFDKKPEDVIELAKDLRNRGWPVNTEGDHRLSETEEGYLLELEWEQAPKNGLLFSVGRSEGDHSSSKSRRHLSMRGLSSGAYLCFNHSVIYAHTLSYLGLERTRQLLTNVGSRIEKEFGYDPSKLLCYADQVENGALTTEAEGQRLLIAEK